MTDHRTYRPVRALIPVVATVLLIAAVAMVAARFAPWELNFGNLVVRSQRGMTHAFVPPAGDAAPIPAPGRSAPAGDEAGPAPTNVVLIIGDGMGVGQLSAASMILHGPYGELTVERAPVTGLMKTHAGNALVTDSAASSTAMATGFKAPKKAISVLADGRVPVTLLEAARTKGLATGMITTSGLVDATPAGFTAHTAKRENYPDILEDMLTCDAELLIGGDWSDYPKALRNSEFQRQLERIDELGAAAGYQLARTAAELESAPGRVLGLFPPRDRGGDAHGPTLDVLVTYGVDRLAAASDGFVLVVESEITDGTGHDNDISGVVDAVRELDETLVALLSWAEPRGDTLVLVTADHDTGGLGVVDGDYTEGLAEVRWATGGHTSHWVPVFAFGPGAEHFGGVIDNTDLGVLIARVLGIDGFPAMYP